MIRKMDQAINNDNNDVKQIKAYTVVVVSVTDYCEVEKKWGGCIKIPLFQQGVNTVMAGVPWPEVAV